MKNLPIPILICNVCELGKHFQRCGVLWVFFAHHWFLRTTSFLDYMNLVGEKCKSMDKRPTWLILLFQPPSLSKDNVPKSTRTQMECDSSPLITSVNQRKGCIMLNVGRASLPTFRLCFLSPVVERCLKHYNLANLMGWFTNSETGKCLFLLRATQLACIFQHCLGKLWGNHVGKFWREQLLVGSFGSVPFGWKCFRIINGEILER